MFIEKLNEVLASEKPFISDRLNLTGFGLSLLINIIHWLILLSKIKFSVAPILLHYNVIYGPDWIGQSFYIYIIPLAALLILLLNFWIASSFYKREKLSSYFLSLSTIGVQIIFLIASLVLISANNA